MADIFDIEFPFEPVYSGELAAVVIGRPGPVGPAGDAALSVVGASPLSGHSVVACDAAGALVPADCARPDHQGAVLGMVPNAYTAGALAAVQTGFTIAHTGWSWVPGPVLVGQSGQLCQVLPSDAIFSQVLGTALSSSVVLLNIQPPLTLA